MTIDLSNFTTLPASETTTVPVAEFRQVIEHLERLISCDYHSARGEQELLRWKDRARNVGAELIGLTCKRATLEDWQRRERAIDRSAALITREPGEAAQRRSPILIKTT